MPEYLNQILENLNPEQREAVTCGDGPLLIVAGAGTGKTAVITRRLAYLALTGKAKVDQILALTFTDKAAGEMQERIDTLLPYGYGDLYVQTFHAFADRILKEFGMEIGIAPESRLQGETECLLLLKSHWPEIKLNYYEAPNNPTKYLGEFLRYFFRLKDEGITAKIHHDFLLSHPPSGAEEAARLDDLDRAYQIYTDVLAQNHALDFADLMIGLLKVLKERPEIKRQLTERFKYILVDEFQDTNGTQYQILKELVGPTANITVVGDDDQAIYQFRGATSANLMKFLEDFPAAWSVCLNQNYRSRQEILDAAYRQIKFNPGRLEDLAPEKNLTKKLKGVGSGGFVEELVFKNEEAECYGVIEKILELKSANPELSWNDFCVLYRANSAGIAFVPALEIKKVPYLLSGQQGLYTKDVILDLIALSKTVLNAHDSLALYRVLVSNLVSLAPADFMALAAEARKTGFSYYKLIKNLSPNSEISEPGQAELRRLTGNLEALNIATRGRRASEALLLILHDSGFLASLNRLDEGAKRRKFHELEQFYNRVQRFEINAPDPNLAHFLTRIEAEMELGETGELSVSPDTGPDFVRLMTVHGAKGLEFKYVFIVNLVEQRFPATRKSRGLKLPEGLAPQAAELDLEAHLAEERRLMYVAMTRAKEGLFLTRAKNYGGEREKKPSKFLLELGFDPGTDPEASAEAALSSGVNEPRVEVLAGPELPKHLSFTQLMAFQSCPLQYKFAHIYHLPVFGSPASSFGRTMHAALEKIGKYLLANPDAKIEPGQVEEFYRESWVDDWYATDLSREEYRARGLRILREFGRIILKDPIRPAFLEQDFTLNLKNIAIKGRIDRIDRGQEGTYEIVDYKTGQPKTLEQVLKDRDARRQLVLYTLAAEDALKLPISKASYYYLENNTKIELEVKPTEILDLRDKILEITEEIMKSNFPPKPGFNCKTCDFRSICEFRQV
ncbi:MAG: ATP-dependent DNA helicase [bacterium]